MAETSWTERAACKVTGCEPMLYGLYCVESRNVIHPDGIYYMYTNCTGCLKMIYFSIANIFMNSGETETNQIYHWLANFVVHPHV